MPVRYPLAFALVAALVACDDPAAPALIPSPSEALLKDVELSRLPSPYYHFEYDESGRVSTFTFASGLRSYVVAYEGDRIAEIDEVTLIDGMILGTDDRLKYTYDGAGRVSAVGYVDASGVLFTTLDFVYEEGELKGVARSRLIDGALVGDKTMAFSYYEDGNLESILTHRLPVEEQVESTTIDRFEQYDDGINVDSFGLLHDEFFDHVVLLPGVQLQKGNPARESRSGDGINFDVDYVYTYDDDGRPLTKNGVVTILNGSDAGQMVPISSEFSYY